MPPKTRSQAKLSSSNQEIESTSRRRKRKTTATTDDGKRKTGPFVAPRDVASTTNIDLSWFFFSTKYSFYKVMEVSEPTLKQGSETFQSVFAKEIETQYGFPADPQTIFFWKPNERLFSIPTAWRDPLPDICTVSTPIPPDTSLYDGIGEDLQRKPRCIHLFVTAEIMIRTSWILFDPEFTDHFPRPMYFSRREFGERTSNHQLAFTTEIKTHYSFNADRSTICFWKPNENISGIPREWKEKMPNIQTVATQIQTHLSFSEEIGENVQNRCIHLFVTAKAITPTSGGCSNSGFAPFRRYYKLIRAEKCFSPSAGACPSSYSSTQSMPNQRIYDGRRSENSQIAPCAPPIHIYHPIFARFEHLLADPQFQPTPEYIKLTCEFMGFLGNITTFHEDKRNSLFRTRIQGLLNIDASPITNEDKTTPDGTFKTLVGNCSVVYGIIELRNEMGAGSGDPSIQAGLSMLDCWRLRQAISDKCCCPTLMITGGGPWLSIMGGAITDKVIVQRLTDLVWMGLSATQEKLRVYQCSRIMNALRITLSELGAYYTEVVPKKPQLIPGETHPRYFPFPIKCMIDQQETEFQYLKPLQDCDTCVAYKARRKDNNAQIVVKFVPSYSEEVHRFLAKEGWAPALHYYGPLPETPLIQTLSPAADNAPLELGLTRQRMYMVVMDYVFSAPYIKRGHHHHLDDELRRILTALHKNGFVLGDLRPPNILVTPDDKVMLVDFDWSGRYDIRSHCKDPRIPEDVWKQIKLSQEQMNREPDENVQYAHYPLEMSERIEWAKDAQELGPIYPEHDWEMFSKAFHCLSVYDGE